MYFDNNKKGLKYKNEGENGKMDNFDNDFNNFEGQPNHEENTRRGRSLRSFDDYEHSSYKDDVEFASDLADYNKLGGNATSGAMIFGGLGIATSLAAMFMYPVILGLIGAAFGIYAFSKGNRVVGAISAIMGIVAAVAPMLTTGPFFTLF